MIKIVSGMMQWFCVHTKPSHEIQALSALTRLTSDVRSNVGEMEIYFPRIKTTMSVAGRLRSVVRPLFPRYFFARFVWERASRFIASRPQIIGIVRFGRFPSVVPERVVEELQQWSVNQEEIFDPTLDLKPGQRVVIQSGPFKGIEAEFVAHLSDQKRVALLLDHLQTQARVSIERNQLKALV